MRRAQLEHAIRAACQIIGHEAVIVVGSQAILGTYEEDELPRAATMSVEVDVLPMAGDNEETKRLADQIVAKLCALREKDRNFVAALLEAGLVDAHVVSERLTLLPAGETDSAFAAANWLAVAKGSKARGADGA